MPLLQCLEGFLNHYPEVCWASMARIGIDVRKIEDFGVGTYTQNLLKNLSELDQSNQYFLFGYAEDSLEELRLGRNFTFVHEGSARYGIMEHVSLPLQIRKHRLDLFHSPHYVLPFFVPSLPVVTIHDIIHVLFPEYLPNRWANIYARVIMARSIRQAACVLTVSRRSKDDILAHFKVDPGKVCVIYNGIDDRFCCARNEEKLRQVRERYQLDAPFILYVGNVKPHKNVGRLIEAFRLLKGDERLARYKLLIIGSDAAKYPAIRSAVVQGNLQTEVRFLGWVPKEFLPVIYQLAECFAYPSLYEGFGFPPLEAMASGTPVVCSSASSLPEIVRDAAVVVDPMDPSGMAKAIVNVLTDGALSERLIERGFENIKRFSWRASADEVLSRFQRIIEEKA